MTWSTLAIAISILAPGLQFLVSPLLFFLAVVFGPSVLAPRWEMLQLGAPGPLLPVTGTEYRALGAHQLSIPVCAQGTELG